MIKDKKEVYLDYSATTYVKPKVLEEMLPYFTENFGNPSSLYNKGLESKIAIKKARKRKIDAVKNFLGLAAILVLPPLGMVAHWLVVGY